MPDQVRRLQIVLIEDSRADVLLILESLRSGNVDHEARVFADGPEALEELGRDERPPDLVFLDLNLPRTDGAEVLRGLRDMPVYRDVPIVVFTSSRSPDDRDQALELGATRCVQKPTQLDDFISAVNGAVADLAGRSRPAGGA